MKKDSREAWGETIGTKAKTDSLPLKDRLVNILRVRSPLVWVMLAELLGTFLMVTIGNGSVAQAVLSRGDKGSFFTINWAYGIGTTMGAYAAWRVSGAHLNPAVSLTMALLGKTRWLYLPCYVMAQLTGAFLSSACVFAVYRDAINDFDGGSRMVVGPNGTAGIFATYPQGYLSTGNGLGDQALSTALLVCCIVALTDSKNNPVPPGLEPLLVGLLVFSIGTSFGLNCGYPINPARDLGPRVFTALAGWGLEVFRAGDHWWWVPIVGPLIGGPVGAMVYALMVGMHYPENQLQDMRETDCKATLSAELHGTQIPQRGVANTAMETDSDTNF